MRPATKTQVRAACRAALKSDEAEPIGEGPERVTAHRGIGFSERGFGRSYVYTLWVGDPDRRGLGKLAEAYHLDDAAWSLRDALNAHRARKAQIEAEAAALEFVDKVGGRVDLRHRHFLAVLALVERGVLVEDETVRRSCVIQVRRA